ncbi:acyl carrier protein phosphodiesterase [Antarcticibacterium sp. 1MA-6-2]|uniref:acyl carrier protein phosphodiesterase n=1 Tax=Antarcticibacterium sp. 1MA-6-2 TaxID=2908210 RepID=UPI001F234F74|nr:acyl carrier protein phosphodiesterase [Antarcticibacterium sp. 1MA-6-2]UJH91270.1 acyl carrier protein phosphodiesterase [Antarcticibacterium sp. 1MA-6-2]
MNYLAHIYLSGENDEIKIGNFIADSVKGKKIINFPEGIRNGIILHRAIDSYTDVHLLFRKSSTRLFPQYRHYSPVIVDVFYDHYLAANWSRYCDTPLKEYVEEFYSLLKRNHELLPNNVKMFLPYMLRDNWLVSYASIEGISKILSQMNQRTKNKSKMDLAVKELELYYEDFEKEFFLFFDDLKQFSSNRILDL